MCMGTPVHYEQTFREQLARPCLFSDSGSQRTRAARLACPEGQADIARHVIGCHLTQETMTWRATTRPDPLYFKTLGVTVCESENPGLAGRANRPFSGPSRIIEPTKLAHISFTFHVIYPSLS
jgi:hypothetical protein